MNASDSIADLARLLTLSGDPTTDALGATVVGVAVLALAGIHLPIAFRLWRACRIARDIEAVHQTKGGAGPAQMAREIDRCFAGSALADSWGELLRRRRDVDAHSPDDRAPIRISDIFAERPLIPLGVRRTLLHNLPALLFGLGAAAMLAGVVYGFAGPDAGSRGPAQLIGLALRSLFWGLAFGGIASFFSLALTGAAESLTARLDIAVALSHRSLSSSEVAMRGAHAQELGFAGVSSLLLQVSEDLRDVIDRGLGRIERSTASAASLVGEEQRRVLELVVTDLAGVMRGGVEEQLTSLRDSLMLATQVQDVLSQSLVETVEQVGAGSEANARVTGSLARAAEAVDDAVGAIGGGAAEIKPLVDHLGEIAGALERTADRLAETNAAGSEPSHQAPAYEAVRYEIDRMTETFLGAVDPLRVALERLDDSADLISGSVADFVTRTGTLEARLAAEESRPRLAAASAAAVSDAEASVAARDDAQPAALDASADEPGGDLLAALQRTGNVEAAATSLVSPATAQPAPRATDEDACSGASALLSRNRAPRFSIEELPDALRSLTPREAAERAQRGEPDAGQDDAAMAPGEDAIEVVDAPQHVAEPAQDDANDQLPPEQSRDERRKQRLERFFGDDD